MDPRRFDAWSKALATRGTRRNAMAAGSGAALLGLLGLPPRSRAQVSTGRGEDGVCRMTFTSTARIGPSVDGGTNAPIAGLLEFTVGEGSVTEGQLSLETGEQHPVTGNATGRYLSLRIEIGDTVLTAIGAGERNARSCVGAFSGPTSGPREGDLGDWQAFAEDSGITPESGSSTTSNPSGASNSSGSSDASSGNASSGGSGSGSSSQPTAAASTSCTNTCTSPRVIDPASCDCVCSSGRVECGPICCYENGICQDAATGQCACPVDYQLCGDVCVSTRCPFNTTFNDATCSCSNVCGVDSICCNGSCHNIMTNRENCGACGVVCDGSLQCVNGVCGCPAGMVDCALTCVDAQNDTANCGGCGVICANGQSCIAGACQCPAGLTLCGNSCVNLLQDRRNCGQCAYQCGAFDSCIQGTCG